MLYDVEIWLKILAFANPEGVLSFARTCRWANVLINFHRYVLPRIPVDIRVAVTDTALKCSMRRLDTGIIIGFPFAAGDETLLQAMELLAATLDTALLTFKWDMALGNRTTLKPSEEILCTFDRNFIVESEYETADHSSMTKPDDILSLCHDLKAKVSKFKWAYIQDVILEFIVEDPADIPIAGIKMFEAMAEEMLIFTVFALERGRTTGGYFKMCKLCISTPKLDHFLYGLDLSGKLEHGPDEFQKDLPKFLFDLFTLQQCNIFEIGTNLNCTLSTVIQLLKMIVMTDVPITNADITVRFPKLLQGTWYQFGYIYENIEKAIQMHGLSEHYTVQRNIDFKSVNITIKAVNGQHCFWLRHLVSTGDTHPEKETFVFRNYDANVPLEESLKRVHSYHRKKRQSQNIKRTVNLKDVLPKTRGPFISFVKLG